MRILIVSEWFHKLVVDGQARALARAGHDVAVLCRDHAHEFGGSQDERQAAFDAMREHGVEIIEMTGRRWGPDGVPGAIAARRAVRRWRPDVASVHQNTEPRMMWAIGRTPYVYTVHDPSPHLGERGKLRDVASDAVSTRLADILVVHGEALRDELPERVRTIPTFVIPHGVEVAADPLPPPATPAILTFGRLEAYKGLDVLRETIELVWEQRPDVQLIVAGSGPAADQIGTEPRIELIHRYIEEREVVPLHARASVSVLPYVQASQSGVGTLSLSLGVPTVVTDVGALGELAVDPSYLAPPRQPRALADRLLEHLDDDAAARDRVLRFTRERFAWDAVAARYEELYERLLCAGGPARRYLIGRRRQTV